MGIQALSDTTVRALGANQVLTDPCSLVKELIDNALDANATTIAVEIHSNTVDSIQVRDNGHGIAPEDRPLVARRYCTSKLLHDDQLSAVSASSLGFRGEALAAAAELSGSLTITTRIEGEQVAAAMKIDSKGEVISQEKASSPVGTTARVTDFIKANPVRRQLALKNADSCLKKIKRLLQSYAFARPRVRLSIRVVKAKKSTNTDWVYAPKLNGNAEDTAFKVVGAACASQCTWSVLEDNGFSLQAFLPTSNAEPAKVSNISAFISLDGRPVSASKGAFKDICKAYRGALKGANARFQDIKDPFLYLDITSPPDSYDANAEPAKDDVVFEDRNKVIDLANKLFDAVYARPQEQSQRPETADLPRSQSQQDLDVHASSYPMQSITNLGSPQERQLGASESHHQGTPLIGLASPKANGPRLRGNMYGCDEEDLALLVAQPAEAEGDPGMEELRQVENDITISNPWVMAKMNAPLKRPAPVHGCSPAKAIASGIMSSSPIKHRSHPDLDLVDLPTPRPSSPSPSVLDRDPDHMPDAQSRDFGRSRSPPLLPPQLHAHVQSGTPWASQFEPRDFPAPDLQEAHPPQDYNRAFVPDPSSGTSLQDIPDVSTRPRRSPNKQQAPKRVNRPFEPPLKERPQQEKVWFDHLQNLDRPCVYTKPRRGQNTTMSSSADGLVPQGELGDFVDDPNPLTPPIRNRDIREFVSLDRFAAASIGSRQCSPPANLGRTPLILETLDLSENAVVQDQPRGFVTGSKLLELEQVPEKEHEQRRRAPKRRKTCDRRALQELSTNAPLAEADLERPEDLAYHPDTAKQTAPKRKASRKLSRRETLKLPLEKTPSGQSTHTLVLKIEAPAREISAMTSKVDAKRTFLSFNEPAIPVAKGLDEASSHTLSLAADLHRLLIRAGSDVNVSGPERLLVEVKTAFKNRCEATGTSQEDMLAI